MQTIIEDNQSIISLLQEEQRNLKQDQANKIDEIQERESTIERLRQEKHELRNWLFTQIQQVKVTCFQHVIVSILFSNEPGHIEHFLQWLHSLRNFVG